MIFTFANQLLRINIHLQQRKSRNTGKPHSTIEINQENRVFIGIDFEFRNLSSLKTTDFIETQLFNNKIAD